jgi:hypothetical protein
MKKYALRTEDPQSVLGGLAQAGISPALVKDAYDEFLQSLCLSLRNNSAEPVSIELHDYIELEKIKKQLLDSNKVYLNFDSQSSLGGIAVGVSRRFDYNSGEQMGITSRPGYDELSDQLARIVNEHGNNFGIIEDDIFTGGTLRVMIKAIQDAGANVDSVISGISSTNEIDNVLVKAAIFYKPESLLELTDPRDYIFGVSNGGLVASFMGRKFRVPYCSPLVDVVNRSSISPTKVKAFSSDILESNINLHKSLGSFDILASNHYPKELLVKLNLGADISLGSMLSSLRQSL